MLIVIDDVTPYLISNKKNFNQQLQSNLFMVENQNFVQPSSKNRVLVFQNRLNFFNQIKLLEKLK